MDKIYLCHKCTFEYTRSVHANKTFIIYLHSWVFCAIGNYEWLGCDFVAGFQRNDAHFAIGRRSAYSKD